MRRSIAAIALAAAAALGAAGPALAWDSVAITIDQDTDVSGGGSTAGGGGTGAVGGGSISGSSGLVIDMLLMSTPMAARPAGDLGPRYVISYSFPGSGATGPLSEDLYPYAPGGPVAYAATAGSIVGHPIQAGWHEGNAAVLDAFVSWGLPATAPSLTERTGGPGLDVRPALAVGALVLLALGIAAAAALAGSTVGPIRTRRRA